MNDPTPTLPTEVYVCVTPTCIHKDERRTIRHQHLGNNLYLVAAANVVCGWCGKPAKRLPLWSDDHL